MFICDKCLKEGYSNTQSIFRSFGRCEFCKVENWCNEIRSDLLVPKKDCKHEMAAPILSADGIEGYRCAGCGINID